MFVSTSINHPLLGNVEGVVEGGVLQFRGIQYAMLENRFASPVIREQYDGSIDARSFGPTVICPPESCDMEQNLIQQTLPKPEYQGMSDLDGLNLVITCPRVDTATDAQLPVVVFIHGGGIIGGNWFPQTNFKGIVGLSARMNRPIIGVGINYRLGPAAWMISNELKNAGYKSNRGLLDQKAAFRWLAKFISGFGGDPNNITSMSESAGSVMNLLHLSSTEPLFKRAIVHGGSPLLFGLLPQSIAEQSYHETLRLFRLQDLSVDQRIESLLQIPAEHFLTQIPPTIPFNPTEDDEIQPHTFQDGTPSMEDLETLPGSQWCQQLMIGSCQLDSQVFEVLGMVQKQDIVAPFIKALETHITDPVTLHKVLEMYDMSTAMSDAHALVPALRFISEVKFCAAAHLYASSWPRDSYLYHFDELNPWQGPWQGYATHGLEIAYLFQNYGNHLNTYQKQVSKAIGADVIEFAYGNAPWTSFREQNGFRVYGNSSKNIAAWVPYGSEDDGRTSRIVRLRDEVGLELCSRAIDTFLHSS